MDAELTFSGKINGQEFAAVLLFQVTGLEEAGEISMDQAKELLVRVAVAITNPEGFNSLARDLAGFKAAKLELVKRG
jgi:hypothetical protein